ncbi:hypothetical protein B7C42_00372 [Nocardia cerradoensis]|uniref:Uncharacterized protein n=1 Tax=Nocardia cerradoensis TaxID=85688 RepID=A0A231HE77_9NOCA|nr:hypothetical protein [Nocardia cerradoensis]OXR47250.1 hypothetical protein B7C42_00372 [Nocardia cerradoensis]
MTRELPFDDDADAGDHANDAAYRVATGVARVARAGAYVTGGALIASNGSPAPENESHNSHITGWSTADPHPDVPSPVVTYPDPSPDSVPPDLGTSTPRHTPAAPAPGLALPEHHGTDAFPGLQFPQGSQSPLTFGEFPGTTGGESPDSHFPFPESNHGFGGNGVFDSPGFGGGHGLSMPGLHTSSAPFGFGAEGSGPASSASGLDLPGAARTTDEQRDDSDLSGTDPHPTTPLLGHGLGLPGTNGLHLPGMNGLGAGGFGSGNGLQDGHGAFDGIGDGGGPGIFLGTEMKVDAHIGFDGVWVTTETKVDFAVGDVGHQLDDYGNWLGNSAHQFPGFTPQSDATAAAGQSVGAADVTRAAGTSADGMTVPAPGATASATQSGAAHPASAAGSAGTAANGAAAPGSSAFAPQSGPMAASAAPGTASFSTAQASAPVTNAAASQPVSTAPVVAAPAPVAPAPAPAFVQPVAATPLQTTIQPEAATHPIANVITTHAGPSPLTAPAVAVPALFDDRPRHTDAGLPGGGANDPSDGAGRSTTHTPTTTSHGTTTTHGTDASKTPAVPSTSHAPGTTPGGEHTTTRPGTSTGRDSADHDSTDRPTPTVTVPRDTDSGHPTRTPGTTPSDPGSDSGPSTSAGADASTPGHTATHTPGTSSGADTSASGDADGSTAPTHGSQLPTHDPDSVPTQQIPTQQSIPPSHDPTIPTHEPTVPTAQHTAPVEPPTVIKPPTTIDPAPNAHVPVKPVAAVTDSYDTSLWSDSAHGLATVSAAGLSGGLHETTFAETHYPVDHPVDFHVLPL